MTGSAVYLILGLALLLAIVLPQVTRRAALSPPMVLVAAGMLIGLLPLPDGVSLEPEANRDLILHVTELCVLVSLMGVGLALDRALDLRSWSSWRTWSPVWRLLAVTMPLTILGVALLGWWVAGLAPAVALLLGAVLSPTDPVLASDVQVGEPLTEDVDDEDGPEEDRPDRDDDIRFSLTAEAGLNDGLAFPFVHLALLLMAGGFGSWRAASGWGGTSSARSSSACWSASVRVGCWAARRSGPVATASGSPTTASRCWPWPGCWRRTARRS